MEIYSWHLRGLGEWKMVFLWLWEELWGPHFTTLILFQAASCGAIG